MYLEFFKFSRKPFNIAPDPDFFYMTESARETYDLIIDDIGHWVPCLLLTGEPGTGKTALLKHLMTNEDANIRWIFINKTQLTWDELLIFIGQDLGLSGEDGFSGNRSDVISEKIATFANQKLYPVLIIDEADHFKNGTLQQLLKWHALNQTRGIPLTIILAGLKRLAQTFANEGQELFDTSLVGHYNLKRFSYRETCAVIANRLDVAGRQGPTLFEDEALKLIQSLSGGTPRVINQICDLGLVLAASLKQQKVTREIILEASEYILLKKDSGVSEKPVQVEPETCSVLMETEDFEVRPRKNPAADSEPGGPGRPEPEQRTTGWRWAVAGLFIVLGCVAAWLFISPSQIRNETGTSKRLVFKVPSKGASEDKKMSAPSPEPLSKKVPEGNSHLASAKPKPLAKDPVRGSSQSVQAVLQPEKKQAVPPQKTQNLSEKTNKEPEAEAEKTTFTSMAKTGEVPAPVKEITPAPQSDQTLKNPASKEDDVENRMIALNSEDSKSQDDTEPGDLVESFAQTGTSDLIVPVSTDPDQPVNPQESEDNGPETSLPLAMVSDQKTASASQDKELQTIPTQQKELRKRITPVSSRLRMPDPTSNAGTVTMEPETTRLSTSPKHEKENLPAVRTTTEADLISAVENGSPQEVQQVIEKGAQIDSVNDTGETALMKAAWAGRTDIVGLLLNHNPRINRQSLEGWTALFYGTVKGHKPVVEALLEAGAKPDLSDQDGRTPLMAAAWNGHTDIVKILLEREVNPNRKNRDGWTPLMFAALKGHVEVAQVLLNSGADPSLKNNEGDTSSKLAAHEGHSSFLSLLSTHGQPQP